MSAATAVAEATIGVHLPIGAQLPDGAEPVAPSGLLSRVKRPCPSHRHDATCIARSVEERLLYWCSHEGGHLFAVD